MNYTLTALTSSLENTALVKIATTLWNRDEFWFSMTNFYFSLFCSERREIWQEIEDRVIEKVSQLPQPEHLKKKILGFIRPIGLQILKWREYHNLYESFSFGRDLLNDLFWTPQGTVDKKRTAEVLIKNESLDITKRYRLACIYCLEDDVRELWNSIPQRNKAAFYNEGHPSFSQNHELVVFWTYDIKGEVAKLNGLIKKIKGRDISPYQFAFEYAAVGGNKAATEYFLQKLTAREREESLVRTARCVAYRRYESARYLTNFPKEHYADVLCFILSQMDEEQKIEVFKSYPSKVLKCLLDWPWQSFFLETANCMWDFLSGKDCYCLLEEMVDKVIEGHKDYDYQKLFGEFWQQSPDAHKRYFMDICARGLLSRIFEIKDERNLKLILENATLVEKRELIFCYRGFHICQDLIYGDEWDLLEFFIRECISSKDEMIKFKEEFEWLTCFCSKEEFAKKKDKWDKFFKLLDDFIYGNNNRKSVAEGDSTPAKRLHSTEFEEVI